MNKKGFTLVELLAVIIILSLLAVLASTSVTKVVTNSKSELYNTQISLIKAAAESWGADNLDRLPSENGECKYISLGQLKKYGILDSSVKNPKTNKEFSDDLNIKVTSNINSYGNLIVEYEVDPSDINSCTPMYEKICTLVSDADNSNSITLGDKYQCKVKDDMEEGFEDGYYFYMLSNNNDGTVNLIMDRNICEDGTVATEDNRCNVAWVSREDYNDDANYGEEDGNNNKGPITAMNYLYNATKDWEFVPNIQMNYTDEGNTGSAGYGSIETTNNITKITMKDGTPVPVLTDKEGYTNLKARMPYYSEVSDYDWENGTNAYLYQNLDTGCFDDNGMPSSCEDASDILGIQTEGMNHINGAYGYWLLSSGFDRYLARLAYHEGYIYSFEIHYSTEGVRPVIAIPQFNIYN